MSTKVEGKIVLSAKHAGAVPLENDSWIWVVIFTAAALSALPVAALFTAAAGCPFNWHDHAALGKSSFSNPSRTTRIFSDGEG
jgi:hypothetical protein